MPPRGNNLHRLIPNWRGRISLPPRPRTDSRATCGEWGPSSLRCTDAPNHPGKHSWEAR